MSIRAGFRYIQKGGKDFYERKGSRATSYLIIMYRQRPRLITPLSTVVIDPLSHADSDIDQESCSPNQYIVPSASFLPRRPPSLLSSIKLKNRIEPNPRLLLKKQAIRVDLVENDPQPYSLSSHRNFYESQQSSQSSMVLMPRVANPDCTKKRLRKLALVPNRVKLERRDETTVECSICLSDLKKVEERKIGRLHCGHYFCFNCIKQSSKFATKCPYCRSPYRQILKGKRVVKVAQVVPNQELDDPMDEPCYICGRNDDFQRLLQCEYCEYAYCHTYCDSRLNSDQPPTESWYCLSCQQLLRNQLGRGEQQRSASMEFEEIYEEES